jgi:hypothetical protein
MPSIRKFRRKYSNKNVNGKTFSNPTHLQDYVRKLFQSERKDLGFFKDLVSFHLDESILLNRELVDYDVVCTNASGKGMNLIFDDCSENKMHSWKKNCIMVFLQNNAARRAYLLSNAVYKFKSAARNEIQDQIRNFRISCPGKEDTNLFHVGHDYVNGQRFDELLRTFVEDEEADLIIHITENTLFLNRNLASKWSHFHKRHAVLRMEAKNENLKGNRGFSPSNWAKKFVCPSNY